MTWCERCAAGIHFRCQEDLTKRLKTLQKHVKEAVEPNKNQIEMLKDLKRLLQCKIDTHKKGNVGVMQVAGGGGGGGGESLML